MTPTAARDGAVDDLVELLASGVDLVSDGGGVVTAARRPVVGRDRVVTFLRRAGPKVLQADRDVRIETVNGAPGFVVRSDGAVSLVGTVDVSAEPPAAPGPTRPTGCSATTGGLRHPFGYARRTHYG